MTRHPATPPEHRARLAELGFGIEVRQPADSSSAEVNEVQRKPDAAQLKKLRKTVRAWKKLCDAGFPDGLEKEDFLTPVFDSLKNEVIALQGFTSTKNRRGTMRHGFRHRS